MNTFLRRFTLLMALVLCTGTLAFAADQSTALMSDQSTAASDDQSNLLINVETGQVVRMTNDGQAIPVAASELVALFPAAKAISPSQVGDLAYRGGFRGGRGWRGGHGWHGGRRWRRGGWYPYYPCNPYRDPYFYCH